MSQSTNAIFAFGIDIGEELPEKFTPDISDAYDFNKSALAEEFGLELVLHCSTSYPMYLLIFAGTKIKASRGEVQTVGPTLFSPSREQLAQLTEFCQKFDIEEKSPAWLLCSYWER